MSNAYRTPMVLLGGVALAAALYAGLQRIGWALPSPRHGFPMAHGPLMIGGFLGTLIGLERAVALGRLWAYLGPLATGVGSVLLVAGADGPAAPAFVLFGSTIVALMFVSFIRRQAGLATTVMALGVFAWWVGNLMWLGGWPLFQVVHLWIAFLVITIAGERLEMGRLINLPRRAKAFFVTGIAVLVVGVALVTVVPDAAVRLTGLGMVVLCMWLYRYDVAMRTRRSAGVTRYVALSLLSGYLWLGASGLLSVRYGYFTAGPYYDAMVHAVMIGFVFSMIMGHGPIVFPAVLNVRLAYGPRFYSHLALLHASLLARVAGDVIASGALRQWGALLNVAAITLFAINMISAAVRGRTGTQGAPD